MNYKYNLINLSVVVGKKVEDIKTFLRFNGIKKFDECDINSLLSIIPNIEFKNRRNFNVSYVIDKLDKEFDLIKLDTELVVNIELKTGNMDLNQCINNYNILKKEYPKNQISIFCYESNTNKIYILDYEKGQFFETDFECLNLQLSKINDGKKVDININVSSVYSDPKVFFEKKYNLSAAQLNAKNKVIENDGKLNIIAGRAGTGKSLLALDIYNYFKQQGAYSVCYLTPFKFNDVIDKELIEYCQITTIKDFRNNNVKYDICIIDEAQRISYSDIKTIDELINTKIIMLGDINQNIDSESAFKSLYEDKTNNIVIMNQSIRTDDTFECFARKVLNMPDGKIKHKQIDKKKIRIEMISGEIINQLTEYMYLEPSKSLYFPDCKDNCENKICNIISAKCMRKKEPHTIISCEYNNVLIYFCEGFQVNDDVLTCNKGICTGNFISQMYAIMTRPINELLILTRNIEIYNYMKTKLEEM